MLVAQYNSPWISYFTINSKSLGQHTSNLTVHDDIELNSVSWWITISFRTESGEKEERQWYYQNKHILRENSRDYELQDRYREKLIVMSWCLDSRRIGKKTNNKHRLQMERDGLPTINANVYGIVNWAIYSEKSALATRTFLIGLFMQRVLN